MQSPKVLDTFLQLYNIETGRSASLLRLWNVTVTKSSLTAYRDGYLCFLWDPSKPKVTIVRISLVNQKLYPVGAVHLVGEINSLLITKDGEEIWEISSFWPQIQVISTLSKRKISQFRVLNQNRNRTPLTFCRYETLWLSDMKAVILVGFNEGSLHIFQIFPYKKAAEAIFCCRTTEGVEETKQPETLVPRININYNNNSTLIILADGGTNIFVFKFSDIEKRLSVTLQARLNLSPQINRLLGEAKEVVYYMQNEWLLVRYRNRIGLLWIGAGSCEFSLIAALSLGQSNNLNSIFLGKKSFWVLSEGGLSKYDLSDWICDGDAKTAIKEFDLPITAVRIKCACSNMNCKKSLASTLKEFDDCMIEQLGKEYKKQTKLRGILKRR